MRERKSFNTIANSTKWKGPVAGVLVGLRAEGARVLDHKLGSEQPHQTRTFYTAVCPMKRWKRSHRSEQGTHTDGTAMAHVWRQGDTHSGDGCSQGNRRPKLARYRRPSLVMSSQSKWLSECECEPRMPCVPIRGWPRGRWACRTWSSRPSRTAGSASGRSSSASCAPYGSCDVRSVECEPGTRPIVIGGQRGYHFTASVPPPPLSPCTTSPLPGGHDVAGKE